MLAYWLTIRWCALCAASSDSCLAISRIKLLLLRLVHVCHWPSIGSKRVLISTSLLIMVTSSLCIYALSLAILRRKIYFYPCEELLSSQNLVVFLSFSNVSSYNNIFCKLQFWKYQKLALHTPCTYGPYEKHQKH